MRYLCLALVLAVGCGDGEPVGDDGTPCYDPALAGGRFPVHTGEIGVYRVEIAQGEVHLAAGFTHGQPEPTPPLARDVRAFIAPDRWLRLTTTDGVVVVQECRSGGTPEGACDDLGPPTGGQLVGYLDGVQHVALPLWTPAWPIEPQIAGCPRLSYGHVDPAR
ncbi:MAG: hypothetical protein KBG48_15890 [Kofleriaceae bacterium]|nr:hypothetical protein [Kofleriaceae bacterium]MBP9168880.1 hypothetical protein [Kofleriaceae bacterium]MBP9862128.1 hypothetical protein [Kofleriaceae bacterium]